MNTELELIKCDGVCGEEIHKCDSFYNKQLDKWFCLECNVEETEHCDKCGQDVEWCKYCYMNKMCAACFDENRPDPEFITIDDKVCCCPFCNNYVGEECERCNAVCDFNVRSVENKQNGWNEMVCVSCVPKEEEEQWECFTCRTIVGLSDFRKNGWKELGTEGGDTGCMCFKCWRMKVFKESKESGLWKESQDEAQEKLNNQVIEEEFHIVSITAEEQEENDASANIYEEQEDDDEEEDYECFDCGDCGENTLIDKMYKVEDDEGDDTLLCRLCFAESGKESK